jgi:hypothetical protein
MVAKTQEEIAEMRALIASGDLPADAIEQYYKAEALNVFGFDAKKRRDGKGYQEQGYGSAGNQTRNSIEAYKKYCSHEVDFERNLARMEKELAESDARRRAAAEREAANG